MAMGKYRIKKGTNGYKVFFLKDYGCGYSWEQISVYSSKEAAQAFIDAEKEKAHSAKAARKGATVWPTPKTEKTSF